MIIRTYFKVHDTKIGKLRQGNFEQTNNKIFMRRYSTSCLESFYYRIKELLQVVDILKKDKNLDSFWWELNFSWSIPNKKIIWFIKKYAETVEQMEDASIEVTNKGMTVKNMEIDPAVAAVWNRSCRNVSSSAYEKELGRHKRYTKVRYFRAILQARGFNPNWVKFIAGILSGELTSEDIRPRWDSSNGPNSVWRMFSSKPNNLEKVERIYKWMVESYPEYFRKRREDYSSYSLLSKVINEVIGELPPKQIGQVHLTGFTNPDYIVFLVANGKNNYGITNRHMILGCTSKKQMAKAGRNSSKITVYILAHRDEDAIGKDYDVDPLKFTIVPKDEAEELMIRHNICVVLKGGKVYDPKGE